MRFVIISALALCTVSASHAQMRANSGHFDALTGPAAVSSQTCDLRYEAALTALDDEQYQKALDTVELMRGCLSHDMYIRHVRGSAYVGLKRFDEAFVELDAAVSKYRRHALVYISRGSARLAAGRIDDAILDFDRGLELDRRSLWLFRLRAEARKEKGDID